MAVTKVEILHTMLCTYRNNIIIVTFYPNGCSQFENPEAPDFEKSASASSSYSTLLLPSFLPLSTSFIKVLPLPPKINHFCFQLTLPYPWLLYIALFRYFFTEFCYKNVLIIRFCCREIMADIEQLMLDANNPMPTSHSPRLQLACYGFGKH